MKCLIDPNALFSVSMSDDDSLPLGADLGGLQQGAIYVPDPYNFDPPLPARERRDSQQQESQESQVQYELHYADKNYLCNLHFLG